ncbi:MAG: hypothetical protein J6E49_01125 [Acidaminococcaceae bacterium]|nr:hypothetical protein [Acidaminococcaceae bacterium]
MARKWLEGAAGLRQEILTQPFTKRTDKRADELISAPLARNVLFECCVHFLFSATVLYYYQIFPCNRFAVGKLQVFTKKCYRSGKISSQ